MDDLNTVSKEADSPTNPQRSTKNMSFVPSQMNPRLAKMNKSKGRNVSHGKTEKIRRTTAGSVDAMRDHSSTKK